MANIFPNLMKTINPHIQTSHKTQAELKKKRKPLKDISEWNSCIPMTNRKS